MAYLSSLYNRRDLHLASVKRALPRPGVIDADKAGELKSARRERRASEYSLAPAEYRI